MSRLKFEIEAWADQFREATIDALGNVGMAAIDAIETVFGARPVSDVEIVFKPDIELDDDEEYELVADRPPQEGDVVCFQSPRGLRLAVYVSGAEVWYYEDLEDPDMPTVEVATVRGFAGTPDALVVIDLEGAAIMAADIKRVSRETVRPFPPAVTVARARARMQATLYHQFHASNAHFALWCALGDSAEPIAEALADD